MTTGAGGSQKIAESLARYSDIILQKKGVQDNKIDDILVWIIFAFNLFSFVDYKFILVDFQLFAW